MGQRQLKRMADRMVKRVGIEGESGVTVSFGFSSPPALIEDYARNHGVQHLGFVDPMLYAIASSP